jgi:hypothetical protein
MERDTREPNKDATDWLNTVSITLQNIRLMGDNARRAAAGRARVAQGTEELRRLPAPWEQYLSSQLKFFQQASSSSVIASVKNELSEGAARLDKLGTAEVERINKIAPTMVGVSGLIDQIIQESATLMAGTAPVESSRRTLEGRRMTLLILIPRVAACQVVAGDIRDRGKKFFGRKEDTAEDKFARLDKAVQDWLGTISQDDLVVYADPLGKMFDAAKTFRDAYKKSYDRYQAIVKPVMDNALFRAEERFRTVPYEQYSPKLAEVLSILNRALQR